MRKSRNVVSNCLQCGKPLEWYHTKFCSNQCQTDYQYKEFVQTWKAGRESGMIGGEAISRHIRRYLIEKHGERCSECGWQKRHPLTRQVPLAVHHVNGDWSDNREENLALLCPNCHSLIETFQNLNRGKGRTYRRRYESRKGD